jgi:hypothetical protein
MDFELAHASPRVMFQCLTRLCRHRTRPSSSDSHDRWCTASFARSNDSGTCPRPQPIADGLTLADFRFFCESPEKLALRNCESGDSVGVNAPEVRLHSQQMLSTATREAAERPGGQFSFVILPVSGHRLPWRKKQTALVAAQLMTNRSISS